jgi:hypothetical protein
MSITPQQRAAKTRAVNREGKRLYEEVSKPAHEKVEKILNALLQTNEVRMRFVGPFILTRGVVTGRLMAICFGGLGLYILPDGYKHARHYAADFWEVM